MTRKILFWLCLIAAPLILVAIESFHPAGFTADPPGMFSYLSIANHDTGHNVREYFGPNWWFTLHMIQTPTVGLVIIGLVLLIWSVKRDDGLLPFLASWGAKCAAFITMIYFTVLDGIGGIGLGRTLEITRGMEASNQLTPDEVNAVAKVLNATWTDSWVGGVGSFVSHTASWAIFFTTVFVGLALLLSRKAYWPPLLVLVAAGWEIQLSHASYHGPIGFGLLLFSSLWIWFTAREKVLG